MLLKNEIYPESYIPYFFMILTSRGVINIQVSELNDVNELSKYKNMIDVLIIN